MEIKKLPKDKFPRALFEIPEPPENLWIIGKLPPPDFKYLSIVGSRKYTSYGKDICEKIIEGLKGYPIVIVSGFAIGLDTIVHKKAMQVGLRTMVFPGSGLSEKAIHPKSNIYLMKEIVSHDGCLVSEYQPDMGAALWTFPLRNRLMAGISCAVLIIEAEDRSGTLITARLATEYNRDVLAVPGSVFSPNSRGTNRLIRQGATPITCSEDVLEALGFENKKEEDKQARLFEDLSNDEKKVIKILREPMSRDDLIRELNMRTSEANTLLSIMEIKGIIKEEIGEMRLK